MTQNIESSSSEMSTQLLVGWHCSARKRTGSQGSRVVTSITAPAMLPDCSALTKAGSSTTGPGTHDRALYLVRRNVAVPKNPAVKFAAYHGTC